MPLHRPRQTETSDSPEEPPKPCGFMKGLLHSLADDTLTGVPRWYAQTHANHCPACSAALTANREREASASTYNKKERQEDQT